MAEAAGFHFEQFGAASSRSSPLVLLHGSGGSENFLMDFARSIAPDRLAFAVRGQVPWEGGYAFFQRNPDRTLDQADLAARCLAFCDFLRHVTEAGNRKPLLVGYSNGAIMAAAAAIQAPDLSAGAILLRPLSPRARDNLPPLHGYPVLLIGGAMDDRRKPSDTPNLAEQFRLSGALVVDHLLQTGHALEATDNHLARTWLAAIDQKDQTPP
jgi:phospholipase/carboxylesterase